MGDSVSWNSNFRLGLLLSLNHVGFGTPVLKKPSEIPGHTVMPSELSITLMILSFRTDMPGKTVQPQIREEQSDQGLHCLPFRLYRLDSLLYCRAT